MQHIPEEKQKAAKKVSAEDDEIELARVGARVQAAHKAIENGKLSKTISGMWNFGTIGAGILQDAWDDDHDDADQWTCDGSSSPR